MTHKVISLFQPWASLVVLGHKRMETRSFYTNYRGPLLIHACKNSKFVEGTESSCCGDLIEELEKINMLTQADYAYPYGAIIGQVTLVDTLKFSEDAESQLRVYKGEKNPWIPFCEGGNDFEDLDEEEQWLDNIYKEMAFGDYSPGRYGWLLSDHIQFKEPIPCKGSQGFWKYEGEILIPA